VAMIRNKSRMSGDAHVRFGESLGVKLPGATRPRKRGVWQIGNSHRRLVQVSFLGDHRPHERVVLDARQINKSLKVTPF
jgi:hypothetical protein